MLNPISLVISFGKNSVSISLLDESFFNLNPSGIGNEIKFLDSKKQYG
jgi:hypothetical protein